MNPLHKLIINNKYLRFTPFWWWWRLISHEGFRLDDYYVWKEFWFSLNSGWDHMEFVNKFEKFWGKGVKAEKIILSPEDYDALQKKLAEPPDPKVIERFREILNKPAPWDD